MLVVISFNTIGFRFCLVSFSIAEKCLDICGILKLPLQNLFNLRTIISDRVATDLENLEKSGNLKGTSESQGICNKFLKVREFC